MSILHRSGDWRGITTQYLTFYEAHGTIPTSKTLMWIMTEQPSSSSGNLPHYTVPGAISTYEKRTIAEVTDTVQIHGRLSHSIVPFITFLPSVTSTLECVRESVLLARVSFGWSAAHLQRTVEKFLRNSNWSTDVRTMQFRHSLVRKIIIMKLSWAENVLRV